MFLEHSHVHSFFAQFYSCFCDTIAKMNSCDRDSNIYCLVLHRKNWPISVLERSLGFAPCHRYLSLHFTEGPEISGEGRSQRKAFTIKTSFFLGITASHPHPLVITRIHGVTVWTTSIDFAYVPMGPLTLHGALQVMADYGKQRVPLPASRPCDKASFNVAKVPLERCGHFSMVSTGYFSFSAKSLSVLRRRTFVLMIK